MNEFKNAPDFSTLGRNNSDQIDSSSNAMSASAWASQDSMEVENVPGSEPVNIQNELDESSDEAALFYPQVKVDLKPMKNQEFQTLHDVEAFYKSYATEGGFNVRLYSTKNKGGVCVRKEFVCSKQGTSNIKGQKKSRKKTKEGCKAKIAVVRRNGKYIVTIFDESHNHALTSPRRKHLLKCKREVTKIHKALTYQLTTVNVPTCQQYDLLGVQSGGLENIGCTQRDIYNHKRDLRNMEHGKDGDMLHEHFLLEKEKNSSFTFKIEADDQKRITHFFWADAISRRSYKSYGDVVIFDTTYNTNRYGLVFAPFVGVNNHGQTVLLACGFLSNETIDSFVWLFKQLLAAMAGQVPKMIITDQDPAMTKAISEVLPQTFHRYCSWHILSKFSEKLDNDKYNDYFYEFQGCIWNSETSAEFELNWEKILKASGLESNGWLQSLYDIRSTWVPAYMNHIFSAGMSSSQRAESGHAFYKRFVSKTNSLLDFMLQFNRAVTRQRHSELEADHSDITEKPNITSPFEMANQIADAYTHYSFSEFEKELKECCNYKFELVNEETAHVVYKVLRKKMENPKGRELKYEQENDFASCSCKKFETTGIPCRHIVSFFIFIRLVDKLPDQYILKRWCKSTKLDVVLDCAQMEIPDNTNVLARRSQLCQYAMEVIDKVVVNDEASNVFINALGTVLEKFNAMVDSDVSKTLTVLGKRRLPSQHIYNEPNQVRAKGCGKRLKRGGESGKQKAKRKATGKGRFCHGCKKNNQLHDKRNCPELLGNTNGSTIQNRSYSDDKDEDSSFSNTDNDEENNYSSSE